MKQEFAALTPPPIEAGSPIELTRREEQLAEAELEAALADARLRGREAGLEVQRQALEARAGWIDGVADVLDRFHHLHGPDLAPSEHLTGLGAGAARQEADLDAYVRRSSTLMLARAAMIATREELLARRRAQQQGRSREIDELEAALVRVEVRLAARERLLLAAVREQEALASQVGAPAPRLPPRPGRGLEPAAHRHMPTEPMTPAEALHLDEQAIRVARRASGVHRAPPVLDVLGRESSRVIAPTLRIGKELLARGDLEIDPGGKTLLASLFAPPAAGGSVELRGKSGSDDFVLTAVVRRVIPSTDGDPAAVVLAPSAWSRHDWERLQALLQALG